MRPRFPKLRELGEAIRAIVQGPFTGKGTSLRGVSPFPGVRYKIEFDQDKCIFCGACVRVCPANARAIIDVPEMAIRRNIHYQDSCIYCGQCVRYCTTQDAIRHTPVFDLASLRSDGFANEIQGELVFCEICAGVVAPKKQLLWIAHKAGALVSANPNLYLTLYRELGILETLRPCSPSLTERQSHPGPFRSDSLRILCPDCRRRVSLRESWGE